ncbi:MAG: hypothetical protein ACI4MB_05705 [Candidatus Coproplasma sp.]
MEIKLSTGIGVPADFKVAYCAKDGAFKGYLNDCVPRSCCKVISADLKLKVYFSTDGSEFLGFEYKCTPELLPAARLTTPFAPDGYIKLQEQLYMFDDINFVAFDKLNAVYDGDEKLLIIGEEVEDLSLYKVCKNMSIGVNSCDRISCFLINI